MSTRYVWKQSQISVSYEHDGYVNSFSPDVKGNIKIKIANSSDLLVPVFSGYNASTSSFRMPNPSSEEGFQVAAPSGRVSVPANAYWTVVEANSNSNTASTLYQAGTRRTYISTDFVSDWELQLGQNQNYKVVAQRSPGDPVATLSNASASTYPLNNNALAITNICAIIPQLIRGYKHVR